MHAEGLQERGGRGAVAGRGAPRRASRWPARLALLLLAGGVAGALGHELRTLRRDMWPYASAPFLVLLGPGDAVADPPAPADVDGLVLDARGPVRALALDEDDGTCHRVERLEALLVAEAGAVLELRLRDTGAAALRLLLQVDSGAGATLTVADGAAGPEPARVQRLPAGLCAPGRSLPLVAALRDGRVELEADGWRAEPVPLAPGGGGTSLRAADGRLAVVSLAAAGQETDMLGKPRPFGHQATWRAPNGAELRAVVLRVLALAAAAAAVLAWWKAALDGARGGAAPSGALATARGLLAATLLAGSTGWILASDAWEIGRERQARAAEAAARAPPPEALHAGPLELDLGNAFTAGGTYRDLDLRARVTLSEGAILGVRLRASGLDVAHGILLALSADGRLASGFRREGVLEFTPLGEPAPAVPAGRALDLQLAARGRDFEARVEGAGFATAADDRLPSGAVVLLALRGSVRVDELEIRGRAAQAVPPPSRLRAARAWLAPLLLPPAALLLFALLAARLLRLRLAGLLEPCAFACVPFLLVALAGREDGRLPAPALRWAGLAAAVLLFLPVARGAPRGAAGRACALLLAALAGVPLAMRLAIPDELLRGDAEALRAHHVLWSGTRQEEDLLHLTHPRFRLQNGWLARHRLRSGEHALAPPAGARRVMFLGASCTWGFRLPASAGLDYPAVVRSLLAGDADGPVEVLNAAYPGAPAFVLLRVFRDALVHYRPDVLVLAAYFADAHQLTQADEEAYYARITAPGARRGPFPALSTLLTLRADQARREGLLDGFLDGPTGAEPRWTGAPHAGTPPALWEATLRDFAAACREHGVDLVLLFEPVAGDAPRLWKAEFLEAMQRVGHDEGVPVVDPRAALARTAPRPPFLDLVHPSPLGHRVIALQVAPVVRRLLADRAAR